MKPWWFWRVVRRVAIGLLSLAVLYMATVAVYRWRGPTQVQRDALASMQERARPQNGVNAFPLLWYMQYDVPDGELDGRMAAEVADVKERLAHDSEAFSHEPAADKLKEAGGDTSVLCESISAGCLAKVSADPRSIQDALATFPTMRAREAAFEQANFYWNEFPADYRIMLAGHHGVAQRIWLSAFALQFVEGDRSGALAGVCRNIDTWRRVRQGTNSSIGSMVAIGQADGGMHLFAEMLAALPEDEEVPPECTQALRPIEVADTDRCVEMSNLFALAANTSRDMKAMRDREPWWTRAFDWLFFDEEQTNAWRAEQFAIYCGDSATKRMLADIPLSEGATPMITRRVECIASLTGCILDDIAAPIYARYDSRTLDFLAHLRLASTLLAMRESGSDESIAVRFENESDSQRSRRRNSGFDREKGVLFVDNLDSKRGTRFELPVPRRSR